MEKSKKLTNTLHLLMALRLSEVNPQRGKKEFNGALNGGIMNSNEDSFIYKNLANANIQGYWYNQIEVDGREWWALTKTLVNRMKLVNDPRLPIYDNPARLNGKFVGLKFGEKENISTVRFSLLGNAIWKQVASVYLVTYAEALFAKAEATEQGWIDEYSKTDYNLAIKESIKQRTGSTNGLSHT